MNQKISSNLYSFFGNEYQNNAYLIINKQKCMVIDPSDYTNEISSFINKNKLKPTGIVLTHGHYDHYLSAETIADKFNVKIYCPIKEKNVILNYNFSKEICGETKNIDESKYIFFKDKKLKVGNISFDVLFTPGHTKGSVCYKYLNYVFSGDTVFYNTIGRSDLETGNQLELFKSIRLFLNTYDHNDLILPGHNPFYKKLSEVKKVNAYLIHFSKNK